MSARPHRVSRVAIVIILAACSRGDERHPAGAHAAIQPTRGSPVATAFGSGGVPLADPAIEAVFAHELTDFETRFERGQVATVDPALRDHVALAAHGKELVAAWADALAITFDPASPPATIRHAASALSDRFAQLGLGYFVDGLAFESGGVHHVALHAYRVDEVDIASAGDERVDVLVMHRLDGLGRSRSLFGMQSEDIGGALVLVDQITDYVLRHYLDVLAPDQPYALDTRGWSAARGQAVAAAAGASLRTELVTGLGAEGASASKIGTLAVERTKLLGDWMTREQRTGHGDGLVSEPFASGAYLDTLGPERDRAIAIDAELDRLGAARVASRMVELFEASVARHEAQHAFDALRDQPLPRVARLAELYAADHPPDPDAAAPPDPAPDEPSTVKRANLELSAYVSEIASEPVVPHLVFWGIARNAFDDRSQGQAEAYVAVVILEGLGRALAVPPIERTSDDPLDRRYLGKLAIAVTAHSTSELRTAAAALWKELYGEAYVPVALHESH